MSVLVLRINCQNTSFIFNQVLQRDTPELMLVNWSSRNVRIPILAIIIPSNFFYIDVQAIATRRIDEFELMLST